MSEAASAYQAKALKPHNMQPSDGHAPVQVRNSKILTTQESLELEKLPRIGVEMLDPSPQPYEKLSDSGSCKNN